MSGLPAEERGDMPDTRRCLLLFSDFDSCEK
jgi:hypothetical protein